MSKIAVVYWSGTGNTEIMAQEVAAGAKAAGAEADVRTPSDFDSSKISAYDAIAFGCPAMVRKCWKKRNSSRCGTSAKAASAA